MKIKRNILLNPGPATTTDSVKLSQIVPDICPREKEFEDVMLNVRKKLLEIVSASEEKYTAVLFGGSGTICIDVIINSLVPKDKKILIINNGSYSQRAVEVCKYYDLNYAELRYEQNALPVIFDIENELKSGSFRVVYATHHETGTGLLNPISEIGELCKKYGVIFAVDTTSSYAMIPIDIEKDNIDFLMSSSQKGIMAMSGLAFIIGNKKMIEESKENPTRSYYCNLYRQYEYFKKYNQMNFTPPVQTIYSVNQALMELFEEGLNNKYKRHKESFKLLRDELRLMGFKFYISDDMSSELLLSILYPNDPNWSFTSIHDYCYARGYTIYPGKIGDVFSFRLSVFGAINYDDIKNFLTVFSEALNKVGIKYPIQYKEIV